MMKNSCLQEYALEDLVDLVLEYFPEELTYDIFDKLGCPDDMDLKPMKAYFAQFRNQFSLMYSLMEESFIYERQHMQVCQAKGPEFLKLYMGNAQMTEYTVKRTDFWEKVANRKENAEKQKNKQTKNQQNFQNGQARKNGSFGRGRSGDQSGKPGQNSNSNYGGNGGNGYNNQKPYNNNGHGRGNNSNNNHFSNNRKCPDCLGPQHGNFPCPQKSGN